MSLAMLFVLCEDDEKLRTIEKMSNWPEDALFCKDVLRDDTMRFNQQVMKRMGQAAGVAMCRGAKEQRKRRQATGGGGAAPFEGTTGPLPPSTSN